MANSFDDVKGFSLEEEEKLLEQRYTEGRRGSKKRRGAKVGAPLNINSMMDLEAASLRQGILQRHDQHRLHLDHGALLQTTLGIQAGDEGQRGLKLRA